MPNTTHVRYGETSRRRPSRHRRSFCVLAALLVCALLCGAVPAPAEAGEAPTEFTGVTGKKLSLYKQRTADSRVLTSIPVGTPLDVIEKGRKWTKVLYEGEIGYLATKYVELVQRRDPFAGPMPGVTLHVGMARVLVDTQFLPPNYKTPIKVPAGSLLSIARVDEQRAYFPYARLEKYVSLPLDQVEMVPIVPWADAQPGDLVAAFTTFYRTGTARPYNAGRMANIDLSCQRLSGVHIAPGEEFSYNAVCAPYTKENGYQRAPILSGDSSIGYGGGTCQVCTTLYNNILRIPAVVVEMHWHAQGGVSYAPAGFDATVGSKSDLRFRNILPYTLRIEYRSGGGLITAMFYRAQE